jgi:hypothetical protein
LAACDAGASLAVNVPKLTRINTVGEESELTVNSGKITVHLTKAAPVYLLLPLL